MIWNGKRVKGVQVYQGKKGSEFAGEYIVVYFCNGYSRPNMIDARVGMMKGDIFPNTMSGVHRDLLSDWKRGGPYVLRSYRELSEEDRRRLESDVIG